MGGYKMINANIIMDTINSWDIVSYGIDLDNGIISPEDLGLDIEEEDTPIDVVYDLDYI